MSIWHEYQQSTQIEKLERQRNALLKALKSLIPNTPFKGSDDAQIPLTVWGRQLKEANKAINAAEGLSQ